MLITKTAPVPYVPDSFVVEIELMMGDADMYTQLTMGPFKRTEHWDNLEHLLQTLERIKNSKFDRCYNEILGFLQWFDVETSKAQRFLQYDNWMEADEEDEPEEAAEQKKAFRLGKGFAKDWEYEPHSYGEYRLSYDGYKLFYFDNSGIKYDTTVQLEDE